MGVGNNGLPTLDLTSQVVEPHLEALQVVVNHAQREVSERQTSPVEGTVSLLGLDEVATDSVEIGLSDAETGPVQAGSRLIYKATGLEIIVAGLEVVEIGAEAETAFNALQCKESHLSTLTEVKANGHHCIPVPHNFILIFEIVHLLELPAQRPYSFQVFLFALGVFVDSHLARNIILTFFVLLFSLDVDDQILFSFQVDIHEVH